MVRGIFSEVGRLNFKFDKYFIPSKFLQFSLIERKLNFKKFFGKHETHKFAYYHLSRNNSRQGLIAFNSQEMMEEFIYIMNHMEEHHYVKVVNIFASDLVNSTHIPLPETYAVYASDPVNLMKIFQSQTKSRAYISSKNNFLYYYTESIDKDEIFDQKVDQFDNIYIKKGLIIINKVYFCFQKEKFLYKPNEFLIKWDIGDINANFFINSLNILSVSKPDSDGFRIVTVSTFNDFLKIFRAFHSNLYNINIYHHGVRSNRAHWNLNIFSVIISNVPNDISVREISEILSIKSLPLIIKILYRNEPAFYVQGNCSEIFLLWFKNGLKVGNKNIIINHDFNQDSNTLQINCIMADVDNQLSPESILLRMKTNYTERLVKAENKFNEFSINLNSFTCLDSFVPTDKTYITYTNRKEKLILHYINHIIKIEYSKQHPKLASIIEKFIPSCVSNIFMINNELENIGLIHVSDKNYDEILSLNGRCIDDGFLTISEYNIPLMKKSSIIRRNEIILAFPDKKTASDIIKILTYICHHIEYLGENEAGYFLYNFYTKKHNDNYTIFSTIKQDSYIFPLFTYQPLHTQIYHDQVLVQNLPNKMILEEFTRMLIDFKPLRFIKDHDSKTIHAKIFPDLYHDIFFLNGYQIDNRRISVINFSSVIEKNDRL